MKTPLRIAIIGGGITGLVAAYELGKSGHAVTVLEASPEVGGLAAGFTLEGEPIERAYHHLFLTDTDVLTLVDELQIDDKLEWLESSMACLYGGKMLPFGTPMNLLRFSPLGFLARVRTGVVGLMLQKRSNWQPLIGVTAASWMRRMGGAEAFRVIWEPLLIGKFHRYSESVSMAWLWARLHTRANSKKSLLQRERLGYFRGGFAVLIDALTDRLRTQGAEVRLHAAVKRIASDASGAVTVESENGSEQFDRVIATVPSDVFARLVDAPQLPEAESTRLQSIPYLGAVCFVFSSEQSLMPYYWLNILDRDFPFLVFVQHTNLTGTARYGGHHVYYAGAYVPHDHPLFTNPEERVREQFSAAIKRMVPLFDPTLIRSAHLFRLRNAQHIVDCAYPDKIPPYVTAVPGVYLSNFSQVFPEDRGTNFAVREGRKIARLLMEE